MSQLYRGRFAPSPTGPLHIGSLIAAVASYLEARTHGGDWYVRIEDLDTPRTVAGASDAILHTLEVLGFEWDDEVVYQSQRTEAYEAALTKLKEKGLVYPCSCSRKEIADSAVQGIDGLIYPGTCRRQATKDRANMAWRIKTPDESIVFNDRVQGRIQQNMATDIGDFVLKRADGLFAYQIAVVIDDTSQRISHIVRGADLLDSTPRQIFLQQALGFSTPSYMHVPIACNAAGEKLSKQTLAQPINLRVPADELWQALDFLGQKPPVTLRKEKPENIWQWAKSNWDVEAIPNQRFIPLVRG